MLPNENITPENLIALLEADDKVALEDFFDSIEYGDLSELFEQISHLQRLQTLKSITSKERAEFFSFIAVEFQQKIIADLPQAMVISIIENLDPVDRTQLLEELPPRVSNGIIEKLSPVERRMAWQLLSYPEDSVGRIMTPEFITIKAGMKVKEALDLIRWNSEKYEEEMIHQLFVIDDQGSYVGDVSLAALVVADPATILIERIMQEQRPSLKATDEQEIAVDYFRKYDRTLFPVTSDNEKLIGVVLAEDMFDAAEEEATEDIQQFGGSATLEDSYFHTPLLTLLKKRAGWLAVLFFGEIYTGTVLKDYDATIVDMRYLVYFLPLIISSGGNSGSQAASLVIRGIAVKEMKISDWRRVFKREVIMGLGLGGILGGLGYIRTTSWGYEPMVGIIVASSLLGIVILGTTIGSMLPFLLKRLNLDPAVSSSPFIASLVDIFGIMILFQMAITISKHWEFLTVFFGG